MSRAISTPNRSMPDNFNRSCEWKWTSGSRSPSEMHRKIPAENASAIPSIISRVSTNWLTVNVNSMAPNGHINEKMTLTVICFPDDQPFAAIKDVMENASNGLCNKIAINTLRPAGYQELETSKVTTEANAMPSIKVCIARPKQRPSHEKSTLPWCWSQCTW